MDFKVATSAKEIHTGELLKQTSKNQLVWQKRFFVLYFDVIIYYKKKLSLKEQGAISLDSIIECKPSEKHDHRFKIVVPRGNGSKTVRLAASSRGERDKWVQVLQDQLEKYKKVSIEPMEMKKEKFEEERKPTLPPAAVWTEEEKRAALEEKARWDKAKQEQEEYEAKVAAEHEKKEREKLLRQQARERKQVERAIQHERELRQQNLIHAVHTRVTLLRSVVIMSDDESSDNSSDLDSDDEIFE